MAQVGQTVQVAAALLERLGEQIVRGPLPARRRLPRAGHPAKRVGQPRREALALRQPRFLRGPLAQLGRQQPVDDAAAPVVGGGSFAPSSLLEREVAPVEGRGQSLLGRGGQTPLGGHAPALNRFRVILRPALRLVAIAQPQGQVVQVHGTGGRAGRSGGQGLSEALDQLFQIFGPRHMAVGRD